MKQNLNFLFWKKSYRRGCWASGLKLFNQNTLLIGMFKLRFFIHLLRFCQTLRWWVPEVLWARILTSILPPVCRGCFLLIFSYFLSFWRCHQSKCGRDLVCSITRFFRIWFLVFAHSSTDAVMFIDLAFPNGTISFVEYIGLITVSGRGVFFGCFSSFSIILQDIWGPENVPPITSRYPSLTSSSQRLVNLENLSTDYLFVCVAKHLASRLTRKPPHVFIFDHVMSFGKVFDSRINLLSDLFFRALGVLTMLFATTRAVTELNYPFNSDRLKLIIQVCLSFFVWEVETFFSPVCWPVTSAELTMENDMMTFMANYASTGNPNTPNALQQSWRNYGSDNTTYVFATPSRVTTSYNEDLCEFWDSVGYQHAGNFVKKLKELAMNRKWTGDW